MQRNSHLINLQRGRAHDGSAALNRSYYRGSYRKEAAKDAWAQMTAWLKKYRVLW